MSTTTTLRSLEKKLDAMALDQLRQVATAQAAEIERLTEALHRAESDAEWCHEQWRSLEDQVISNNPQLTVGLTKEGDLLLVQREPS